MAEVVRQKNKKINKNRIISLIIFVCSIACLIYCGSVIYTFASSKRENSKLTKQKENLSLKYQYYRTMLEHDDYKVIIQENGYCYEVGNDKVYKCR